MGTNWHLAELPNRRLRDGTKARLLLFSSFHFSSRSFNREKFVCTRNGRTMLCTHTYLYLSAHTSRNMVKKNWEESDVCSFCSTFHHLRPRQEFYNSNFHFSTLSIHIARSLTMNVYHQRQEHWGKDPQCTWQASYLNERGTSTCRDFPFSIFSRTLKNEMNINII